MVSDFMTDSITNAATWAYEASVFIPWLEAFQGLFMIDEV